jgi:hypothetical protein
VRIILRPVFITSADSVAARLRAPAQSTCLLDSEFESDLKLGCLFMASLYCTVLCRYRLCNVIITRPMSRAVCR